MKTAPQLSPRNERPSNALPPAAGSILLLGNAAFYSYTRAPILPWGDDAMFQRALAVGALTRHPVWGVLARLFARLPWGDFAFRANLASAVYAVGVVGFLFLTTRALSGSSRAALSAVHENKGRRPIFLADTYPRYYPIAELTEGSYLEPVGPVFRLVPREEGQ
jgi:hypothetical protein